MTDEERVEFERLKARVAELEARPSDPQALEAAIKGSAMEKVARLELATLPPGWNDEYSVREVVRIGYPVAGVIALGIFLFLAFHSFVGWPN